ncbi:MAG: hypothetical protein L6R42_000283 [Xanthoria sp. 1 TBL-2021]|nr:MAG: hypothetical protein L6R42_000283 [Xanthoria sp. 1 TBL-2021]
MNVAKTLQYRSSIRDSESEKQPQEVYNLDSPVGCVVGNKGNSFVLNAVPTSSKRNAPENDDPSNTECTPKINLVATDVTENTSDALVQMRQVIDDELARRSGNQKSPSVFELHAGMDGSKKWAFKTGVTFEDQLVALLKLEAYEDLLTTPLAQFLVDVVKQNATLRNFFGHGDFQTIYDNVVQQLKPLPESLNTCVDSFNTQDTKQLYVQIGNLLHVETPNVDFIYREWLSMCLTKYLQIYRIALLENENYSEHWYSVNIWGPVVDMLLQSIPDTRFHRGEIMLAANQARKYNHWQATGSKGQARHAALVDGKLTGPQGCEYFVLEASKTQGGGAPKAKSTEDYDKVGRHLLDMASSLEGVTDAAFLSNNGVQLIGCICSGASISFYGLSHRGYTSFFYPLGPKFEMPKSTRCISKFLNILKQMISIHIHLNDMVTQQVNFEDPGHGETVITNPTPKKAKTCK